MENNWNVFFQEFIKSGETSRTMSVHMMEPCLMAHMIWLHIFCEKSPFINNVKHCVSDPRKKTSSSCLCLSHHETSLTSSFWNKSQNTTFDDLWPIAPVEISFPQCVCVFVCVFMRFKEVCAMMGIVVLKIRKISSSVSIVGLSELTVGSNHIIQSFFFLSVLLSFCHSVGFLMQVMFAFKKIKHKPTWYGNMCSGLGPRAQNVPRH